MKKMMTAVKSVDHDNWVISPFCQDPLTDITTAKTRSTRNSAGSRPPSGVTAMFLLENTSHQKKPDGLR